MWIKNLLDTKYATRGYIFNLGIISDEWVVPETESNSFLAGKKLYKSYGNPRTIGVSLTYSF